MGPLYKFIKSLTYNHFLASLIIFCCGIALVNVTRIAEDIEVAVLDVVLAVVSCSVLVFGFFGHFYNIKGAIFKALSFLVIGVAIVYATSGVADKNILLIVRSSVGLFIIFGIYVAVMAVRSASNEEYLIKNGYELDAMFKEVKCVNTGEVYVFSILATAQHPTSGDVLTFQSEETFKNLEYKVHEGDSFKIYLDKKKPDKYIFKIPEW